MWPFKKRFVSKIVIPDPIYKDIKLYLISVGGNKYIIDMSCYLELRKATSKQSNEPLTVVLYRKRDIFAIDDYIMYAVIEIVPSKVTSFYDLGTCKEVENYQEIFDATIAKASEEYERNR